MPDSTSLLNGFVDLVIALVMISGAAFKLLAAIGMVRLPDVYLRLHASTKSTTLGVSGMFLATAIYFGRDGQTDVVILSFLVILFIFMTAPVAGHVIARASYIVGAPLWEKSVVDELQGRYEPKTGILRGPESSPEPQNPPKTEP